MTDPTDGLPLDGSVVVVGAGLGGLRAVEGLRKEGFTGRLVLVGEEQHPPYDRPPLSKQVLAGTWPPDKVVLADQARLDALGVELRLGHRATSLDAEARRLELDDGTVLSPDAVVIATGARPRPLPGVDDPEATLLLRTIEDAQVLRQQATVHGPGSRVVVVGAGFIGSEVASTCAGLGCEVTVVEVAATPLSLALGEEVGRACGAMHGRNGVTLLTGVGVTGVRDLDPSDGPSPAADGRSGPRWVDLGDGRSLAADVVVVGIGVVPNVQWLEGSGLEVSNGVVCDPARFAADGVVVVGDMARWRSRHDGGEELVRIEHWEMAATGGEAGARALLAGRDRAPDFSPVPYFWSDQYGLKIQMLGRPEPDDEIAVVDGSFDEERFVVLYGRRSRLTAVMAIGRPRQLMSYRPLLANGSSWDDAVARARA
jgi:NADPH-dependent 2,4-dienoyl-CoA reductase/sulfur reductase-like enzyme